MKLNRIDHINIVVNDLKLCCDFFLNLDFEIIQSGHLAGDWLDELVDLKNVDAEFIALRLPGDSCVLELLKYNNPQNNQILPENSPNLPGLRHIAFSTGDIMSLAKDPAEVKTYPATGKKLLYIKGPEGIILEFTQYLTPR